MNSMQKLIATSACVGAVILATSAGAAPSGHQMNRDSVTGQPGHAGSFRHARWGKGRHRGGFGHVCGKRREAKSERMISVVEGLMTFSPKQEAAWKDLTSTVRDNNKSMDATCATLKQDKDKPKDATQRFARMETMLSAGLKFVQSVRPKFDSFYATLSEKQKKAFDSLSSHRRRH
jgi:hypothetical protein